MYLVERTLVLWNWIWCPKFILMVLLNSGVKWPVWPLSQCFQSGPSLMGWRKAGKFPRQEAKWFDIVSRQHPVNEIKGWPGTWQEGDRERILTGQSLITLPVAIVILSESDLKKLQFIKQTTLLTHSSSPPYQSAYSMNAWGKAQNGVT
jgi:hypothetical protein